MFPRAATSGRRWEWWLGALVGACIHGCGAPRAQGRAPVDDAWVVLIPRDVVEIDPRFSTDAYGHKVSRTLFASLVTIDAETLEPKPDLAESVEVVSPTHVRVQLRPGLLFSDGSTLDAHDVVATFRSIVDPKLQSRYARTYERIERMEVQGDRTIDFFLSGPHATFVTDLEMPVLRAEDAERHLGELGEPPPVGAGPYVLARRTPGMLELVANPHWHGGTPRFAHLRLLVVHDDNTRALRLLAGAADLALNALPAPLLPLFERDPHFVVRSAAGVGTSYVGLNLEAPALRDVRVRRALAYALDREQLIRTKLGGRARLASGWIVPGHWAFSEATPRYGFDLGKAKALLHDALGDAPSARLHLTLRCGSDRYRQSIARAVAAMWARAGVDVEIRPSEVATLIADLTRGRFELTMLELPELVEPHTLSQFFASDRIPGEGQEGANRWRLRSPALDAALEAGRANVDREVRRQAYATAQRLLAEELPVIPLWHEDVVAVESARLKGFVVPRLSRFDPLFR